MLSFIKPTKQLEKNVLYNLLATNKGPFFRHRESRLCCARSRRCNRNQHTKCRSVKMQMVAVRIRGRPGEQTANSLCLKTGVCAQKLAKNKLFSCSNKGYRIYPKSLVCPCADTHTPRAGSRSHSGDILVGLRRIVQAAAEPTVPT